MYCQVAVNFPFDRQGLTYSIPEGMELQLGNVVEVPLGRRTELGCVIQLGVAPTEDIKLKPIKTVRSDYATLREDELKLFQWMTQYYHYGLGQLIFDCLPNAKKRPRPLKPLLGEGQGTEHVLTNEQSDIVEKIKKNLKVHTKHLVHGVTGSGKTRIFLELAIETLRNGKSVLYLLPEINLTPQFIQEFSRHVPTKVYPYHSELTASQKYLTWLESQESTGPKFFIGVRSSVFLPINNLGLIIVDEEHDHSFKQEDRCPYHARDVAFKKAQLANCPIVLGSATPSLETWYHFGSVKEGTHYHTLRERVGDASLPEIITVDTRTGDKPKVYEEDTWPLHETSLGALKDAVDRGEQALVFINRLGFANYIQCRQCGHQFKCKNCSTTLRFFKKKNELSCQHCDYREPMPQGCPACGGLTLLQKGFGTERVQQVLQQRFRDLKIDRFDRDEIKTFKDLQEKLRAFHAGEIDILVGTQMLSKGHNFRKVKVVVILGVDNQLNAADFRASEKVWQTIVQVSGRAGRYSPDGKVYVHTAAPDTLLFDTVKKHSFDGFYHNEIPIRKICECPPFNKIVAIYLSGKDGDQLTNHALTVVAPLIRGLGEQHFPEVKILGPRPSIIEKKANQYTWVVLLKSKDINQLHNLIKSFQMNWPKTSSISIKIDVDPQQVI